MKGFRLFVILLSWHPDATRFVLPLTRKAGFRLAGWPLPRGCRTLWTTTKGFRSHDLPPFLASWRYLDPP
jgi:hypothetical protein